MSDGPAVCDFDCGVLAVGRCRECGLAFCISHRSVGPRVVFTDWCASCQREGATQAARSAQAATATREQAAQETSRRIAAEASRLAASGIPPTPRQEWTGEMTRAWLGNGRMIMRDLAP